MSRPQDKFKVISVLMGLGHMRAAYPFKKFVKEGIFLYGIQKTTPPEELKIWKKVQRSYYFLSRAERFPLFGRFLKKLLSKIESIEPYYTAKDLSRPTYGVKYLKYLTKKKNFFKNLKVMVKESPIPMLHTFYATALAVDNVRKPDNNFLMICDADFNRIWVRANPKKSSITYLAPCTQVKWRLESYGVKPEFIHITGFPLPLENIGSRENMEILKEDLFNRLKRLDPHRKFFDLQEKSVLHWLDQKKVPDKEDKVFTVTFAIGGAGAQIEFVDAILSSLKNDLQKKRVKLKFSAGIQKPVFEKILSYINKHNLSSQLGKAIEIIYHDNLSKYFDRFNKALRTTDILWTKPSELSFYSGLGIPILLAPSIGPHEKLNRQWLREINAGIKAPGPPEYAHQWLFDLRENGRFAESAWNGFLRSRTLGTYKIMDLMTTGTFDPGRTPLDQ